MTLIVPAPGASGDHAHGGIVQVLLKPLVRHDRRRDCCLRARDLCPQRCTKARNATVLVMAILNKGAPGLTEEPTPRA